MSNTIHLSGRTTNDLRLLFQCVQKTLGDLTGRSNAMTDYLEDAESGVAELLGGLERAIETEADDADTEAERLADGAWYGDRDTAAGHEAARRADAFAAERRAAA
jgi:hypothetical protein